MHSGVGIVDITCNEFMSSLLGAVSHLPKVRVRIWRSGMAAWDGPQTG
jgi:hypothetical protein